MLCGPSLLPGERAWAGRKSGRLFPSGHPCCICMAVDSPCKNPLLPVRCCCAWAAGWWPRSCAPLPGCHLARGHYFSFNSFPFLEDFPDREIQPEAAPAAWLPAPAPACLELTVCRVRSRSPSCHRWKVMRSWWIPALAWRGSWTISTTEIAVRASKRWKKRKDPQNVTSYHHLTCKSCQHHENLDVFSDTESLETSRTWMIFSVQKIKVCHETEAVPKEIARSEGNLAAMLLCRLQRWWELGLKCTALKKL